MDASTWENCSMYRGHLRLALLKCLTEGEMHGLQMIRRIRDVTSGTWEPSPGSVYPVLQEFEKAGLVSRYQKGRSQIYDLTEEGWVAFGVLFNDVKEHMDFLDWVLQSEDKGR